MQLIRNINLYHHSIVAMNSQLDMVFWGDNQLVYNRVYNYALETLQKYELLMSRYNKESELYHLNKNGYVSTVFPGEIVYNTLEMGIEYHRLTQGYFDVTLGNVYQANKNGQPNRVNVDRDLTKRIEIDTMNRSVRFLQKNVSIDLGGIGKGIALNEIGKMIDELSLKNCFLSFGGSSVLTRGRHPHGDFWPFGLSGILDSAYLWELQNHSLSVSSSKSSDKKIAHIVNPHTYHPIQIDKSAVVQCNNAIDAEVLSTTLIASPAHLHADILQNFNIEKYLVI